MKRFMLAAVALAFVAINPAAMADPGWNGGGHVGAYQGGGNHGGNNHGGGGYHPPSAPPPQGKNNAGRRPHYGNGSNNGYYHAGYAPQGKNNAGRRPHYGNGSNYYAGYPSHGGNYPYKGWYGHAGHYPYYRPYYRPYYGRPYPYYGYRPVGYPAYYGYPYNYGHHNNNNNSDWPAYLIGGAVLGSVLTNVYQNSQAQYAPANQVITAPQGRRLLRDLNGNCYERMTDANGNELRTELPPSQCNW
jgi:hypothetical protein